MLRAGYDLVAEKERGAQDLVDRLGKGLKEQLADRLVERGVLERRDGQGARPVPAHPVAGGRPHPRGAGTPSAHRRAGAAASSRTSAPAALVALLSAIDKAHKVVDHEGLSSREVRKRAKQISEGAWAAKAVRDAISASVAAIGAVAAARRGRRRGQQLS